MRTTAFVPQRRGWRTPVAGVTVAAYVGMTLLAAAIADAKINNPTVLSGRTKDSTATNSGASPNVYYDTINGNDSWDGTVPFFTSGTTGPKATFPSAINAGQKIAVLTGSVINVDYSSGNVSTACQINATGQVTICAWSRLYNQEVTPATPGYIYITDQIWQFGTWRSAQYMNDYFFKVQGTGKDMCTSSQGAAFNMGSVGVRHVIRNCWSDGNVMLAQSNYKGYVLEDCEFTNGAYLRRSATNAVFTASITSNVMTVTSIASGVIYKGMTIYGANIAGFNRQITSNDLGGGTYNVASGADAASGTVNGISLGQGWMARCEAEFSGTATVSGTTMTIASLTGFGSYLDVGATISGTGITTGTTVLQLLSGTGAVGSTYQLSTSASIGTATAISGGILAPRVARCAARPGSIGEDCLHFQGSNGFAVFSPVVVDNVFIHDATTQTDTSRHCDWMQFARDIMSPVVQGNLIQHTLGNNGPLTDYQGSGSTKNIGSVWQGAAGGTGQSVLNILFTNNVVASNNNIWNHSTVTASSTSIVRDNTFWETRDSVTNAPGNAYISMFNESGTTAYTLSNNWATYTNSFFGPPSANDSVHDSFMSGVNNFTSGFTYKTA